MNLKIKTWLKKDMFLLPPIQSLLLSLPSSNSPPTNDIYNSKRQQNQI